MKRSKSQGLSIAHHSISVVVVCIVLAVVYMHEYTSYVKLHSVMMQELAGHSIATI